MILIEWCIVYFKCIKRNELLFYENGQNASEMVHECFIRKVINDRKYETSEIYAYREIRWWERKVAVGSLWSENKADTSLIPIFRQSLWYGKLKILWGKRGINAFRTVGFGKELGKYQEEC